MNNKLNILFSGWNSKFNVLVAVFCLTLIITGCKSPQKHRIQADKTAYGIIDDKMQSVGRISKFSIEKPSDTLRRRLLIQQKLPVAGQASFGTDQLTPIEHWPEKDYPKAEPSLDPIVILEDSNALKLTLMDALQVGAANNFEYQTRKEDIFTQALNLDLERNEFRTIFNSQIESLAQTDTTGDVTVGGLQNTGALGVSKTLPSGAQITGDIAISLANLLTPGNASSLGVSGDASVAIPLLRGSGRYIVTEPLIQADRDVIYSIYEFERYRQTFAVSVASEYLNVLRQIDVIANNLENYKGLIRSARRARRLADVGRLTEVQVDQAVQDELRARNSWISATENYKNSLDDFKNLLGLPADADIELDRTEMKKLTIYADKFLKTIPQKQDRVSLLPAYAPIIIELPDMSNVGPLEIDESNAIQLGFDNRYDLFIAHGKVYDAQRAVVVFADNLRAELTLLGNAHFGGNRTIKSATNDDIKINTNEGIYTALLNLDLPLERTAERNEYRLAFVALEQAVRDVQILEDNIKINIRTQLRDLLESREGLLIQAKSVKLAEKRVRSTNLFLEAGRAEIRDVLDSQESLLNAQNALTAAIVNYRIAELQLQQDMGVLKIEENGLWQEYNPGEK